MLRRLVFLAFLAFAPAASAATPDCGGVDLSADPSIKVDWSRYADDMVNAEGLLWKVEKPGVAPSYLYGTMHSTNEGPMRLAREAAPYAEKAKAVATELGAFGNAERIEISAKMLKEALSPDKDTWAGLIEGKEAAKVEALLKDKGTPPEMAHHLKLWMLAVAVSLPNCEIEGQTQGLPEVDQSFVEIAKAKGIPVTGLESIEEQTRTLAAIPAPLAAQMLKTVARGGAFADGGYRTLLALYVKKKPTAAQAVLDAAPGVTEEDRQATAELTKRLLADRNDTMLQRATPLLDKGGAFVAVGALHLSGKTGLIEGLRAKGWTVTKVW